MTATQEYHAPARERHFEGLIWARLGRRSHVQHVWLGMGLLSDYGLPLDVLQMFLAAKRLYLDGANTRPVHILLADSHALSNGAEMHCVALRAATRTAEVRRIGALIDLPLTVHLASEMDADPRFQVALARAEEVCARDGEPKHRYTIRGVADVLHLCQDGGVKVGWTHSSELVPGRGRHHEFETDALAYATDSRAAAVYVRHGVTLDSTRPVAVPYTEMKNTASRLMLTGPDQGRYREKLSPSQHAVTANRRAAVLSHLAVTIAAFEDLVGPLAGSELVEKAEAIVAASANCLNL